MAKGRSICALAMVIPALQFGACQRDERRPNDTNEAITPSLLLEIGTEDGPTAFTAIGDFYVDEKDRAIYVAQPADGEIRILDESGRPLKVIGRRGSGPGEFQGLATLGKRDNLIWAYDRILKRVTYFDRTGRIAREVAITGKSSGSHRPFDSAILLVPALLQRGNYARRLPMLLIEPDGAIVDTVAFMNFRRPPGITLRSARGEMHVTQPLQDQTLMSLSDDGTWLVVADAVSRAGASTTATVAVILASGDTTWKQEIGFESRPVPEDYLAFFEASLRRSLAGRPDAGSLVAQVADAAALPKYLPPVDRVVAARDGSVWLRRTRDRTARIAEWLVVTEGSRSHSRVVLPAEFNPRHITRDALWGVVVDSIGLHRIQKFAGLRGGAR